MKLDYREIGARIARCRRRQKLTQAQVAELADISNQYLSSIERAVSIPSTEVIMRLAAALDTTPDEFLVGTAGRRGSGGKAWRSICGPWMRKSWISRRAFSPGCASSRKNKALSFDSALF